MTPERLNELKERYSFLLAHAESFYLLGDKAIANYFLRLNKDVAEMLEEIERLKVVQKSSVCYPIESTLAPPEGDEEEDRTTAGTRILGCG